MEPRQIVIKGVGLPETVQTAGECSARSHWLKQNPRVHTHCSYHLDVLRCIVMISRSSWQHCSKYENSTDVWTGFYGCRRVTLIFPSWKNDLYNIVTNDTGECATSLYIKACVRACIHTYIHICTYVHSYTYIKLYTTATTTTTTSRYIMTIFARMNKNFVTRYGLKTCLVRNELC